MDEYPHIVEVNLLGMTGIIVERFLCKDVQVNQYHHDDQGAPPPSPPHDMKVMVFVNHSSLGTSATTVTTPTTAFGVSAVSCPLQRSAGKEGIAGRVSGKQRYLAIWNDGNDPSLVFETDIPRKKKSAKTSENFVTSKKFELQILMVDVGKNATIPLGRAILTLRPRLDGSHVHNLVVHPPQPREDFSSRPVYSVDPSARLRLQVTVQERMTMSWGIREPPYQLQRFVSKPEDSIEVIEGGDQDSILSLEESHLLCTDPETTATIVSLSSHYSSLIEEEKKDDFEVDPSCASMESECFEVEAFEVQEDESFKICGKPVVPSEGTNQESNSATSSNLMPPSSSRPPKPPQSRSSKATKKSVPPPPPPPPSTPPPKTLSSRPTRRPSDPKHATIHSSSDNSTISSSSLTRCQDNKQQSSSAAVPTISDLDKAETESKTSTGSKTSGSSFSAGLLSNKPQLISHLHQLQSNTGSSLTASKAKSDESPSAKFQLRRQLSKTSRRSVASSPRETSAGNTVFPSSGITDDSVPTNETPAIIDDENTAHVVHEGPVSPIWTEQWGEDGDDTTMRSILSDDDTGTYHTRQTATTYDQSQWESVEKVLAMIPWSRIDSIIDRTKIDSLIDQIPIGTLTKFASFASPAEFDDDTYDNASLCQDSTLDTVTDEGSLTNCQRTDSYDDDTFIERHASLFKSIGCWIPAIPSNLPREEPLIRRSSRFEPKFDLPDHDTAVGGDDDSTADYASIAAASKSGHQDNSSKPPEHVAEKRLLSMRISSNPGDLDSLVAMSVQDDGRGSIFKSGAAPFTKHRDEGASNSPKERRQGPDAAVPQQTQQNRQVSNHDCPDKNQPVPVRLDVSLAQPVKEVNLLSTPQRTIQSETLSPLKARNALHHSSFPTTDSSPIGVTEFPSSSPRRESRKQLVSITDLFHRKDKVDDESLIDARSQPEIFVVLDDGESLGELTMNTHELVEASSPPQQQDLPSSVNPATPSQEGGTQRNGSRFLSLFSCGNSDGLCASTNVPEFGIRPPKIHPAFPGPRQTPSLRHRKSGPDDELTYDESLYSSPEVPVEMRAAAEAAWAKRSAEIKRGRPVRRDKAGFEV